MPGQRSRAQQQGSDRCLRLNSSGCQVKFVTAARMHRWWPAAHIAAYARRKAAEDECEHGEFGPAVVEGFAHEACEWVVVAVDVGLLINAALLLVDGVRLGSADL